jgi:hypothetical protein
LHEVLEAGMSEMSSICWSEFFKPEGKTQQEIADWSMEYYCAHKKASWTAAAAQKVEN